jgi:aspartyl-tRNA(Asn)/glutamyl-tRNA(Gln) amidotransferase subunit B
MFYRKNYFYPDMSKNFQTTQGPVAFCMRGGLDLDVVGKAADERVDMDGTSPYSVGGTNGYTAHIGITRIHMEEDAGKMVHVGGTEGRITNAAYSLVDYNRCGTPLIELVTEPDLRTPEEARLFMQKLRAIYLALGITDASMEQGSLRCDGNVSLRRRGETELGTKTELKNMNSFKTLHDGLAYEICRQAEVLEDGGAVRQETRHFEPATKRTVTMRVKETADDYRLFPEPDLAPYDLSDEFIDGVRSRLPELPDSKRERYLACGLSYNDASLIADDPDMSAFFDSTFKDQSADKIDLAHAKHIANFLLNDVAAYLNEHNSTLANTKLTPEHLIQLAELVSSDTISSKQAKEVLADTLDSGKAPADVVDEKGMKQVSDAGEIEALVDDILGKFPDKVAEYKDGKTGLIGFFVGQAMKATNGQGNPKLINQTFTAKLA